MEDFAGCTTFHIDGRPLVVRNTFLDIDDMEDFEPQVSRRSSVPRSCRLLTESHFTEDTPCKEQVEDMLCQEDHADTSFWVSDEASDGLSTEEASSTSGRSCEAVGHDLEAFDEPSYRWPVVVKNTFLHLGIDDDESDRESPVRRFSTIPSNFRLEGMDEDGWSVESDSGDAEDDLDERTTVMLRNLPEGFSRRALEELLDQEGFAASYDFVYVPADICTGQSFFYAFVNLTTPREARRFHHHFTGFCSWPVPCSSLAAVEWSEALQGLDQMTERYRNSPMMHPLVPDDLRPALYSDGTRVAFPAPSRRIPAPRLRRGRNGSSRRLTSEGA